jgi:hypothetical protein
MEGNEMGGAYGTYGENRNAYRVLVRKHEAKRRMGRHSNKWEDNIKNES